MTCSTILALFPRLGHRNAAISAYVQVRAVYIACSLSERQPTNVCMCVCAYFFNFSKKVPAMSHVNSEGNILSTGIYLFIYKHYNYDDLCGHIFLLSFLSGYFF